ncbi:carbohydrate-binding module family 12 protein [Laccaria bicolor S238N-H82]|uniref:Carbohydrate-binding module family 12 protein n=1 Tax=Laccaria bicolor (strain S238N-H82 / ATCC MYA-4686) TaxID=486041 RepID=B0DMU6_LACBS|nr:carbohydrate-binding module family 12 protein [Laccaria bicolor S238N-H82]EDR04032.1 carbohydrate-binding module family 12 protein [Laccaria bicolor S238N-H82]|eukprot:XP_001885287.1 carbohydrate-binding module family 12 protein [Laccaria bicolor S238N-H82]
MTQYWEPGTQYNYDDVVEYEGSRYKIIQPHRSQSDWTPPATPALWGRLSDGDNCCQQKSECQQPQQYQQSSGGDQYSNNQGEEKKGWLQDEKHKKELEIGAGVAAGAAALAGGAYAYKHHQGHEGGAPEESRGEKVKDWAEGHKKELEIGAGLVGAAALAGGAYALKKHHDNQGEQRNAEEEGQVEQAKHWAEGHKKELEIGGGLLAGAAALAGGAYAYKKHEEHKHHNNDDVQRASVIFGIEKNHGLVPQAVTAAFYAQKHKDSASFFDQDVKL